MQKSDTLDELIELVKNLGRLYDEENIRVNIDFDSISSHLMLFENFLSMLASTFEDIFFKSKLFLSIS